MLALITTEKNHGCQIFFLTMKGGSQYYICNGVLLGQNALFIAMNYMTAWAAAAVCPRSDHS